MIISFFVYIMTFGYMIIVFVVNMKNIEGDKMSRLFEVEVTFKMNMLVEAQSASEAERLGTHNNDCEYILESIINSGHEWAPPKAIVKKIYK